jgi:hypothetical protein
MPTTIPGGYRVLKELGTCNGLNNEGIALVQSPRNTNEIFICKTVAFGEPEADRLSRMSGFDNIIQLIDFIPSPKCTLICDQMSNMELYDSSSCVPSNKNESDEPEYMLIDEPPSGATPDVPTTEHSTRDPGAESSERDRLIVEFCGLGCLADVILRHTKRRQPIPESFI